jgi:hypothetical protein
MVSYSKYKLLRFYVGALFVFYFTHPFKLTKMKVFNFKSPFTGEDLSVMVNVRSYNNGRPALELLEEDMTYGLTPYAVATVNLPDVLLQPNEVLIKDYAENEGILQFLIDNNIVVPTKNGVQSGYVWVPVCILNDESVWGETPNLYSLDEEPEYQVLKSDVNQTEASLVRADGKQLFIIKDYRIWASSEEEANKLLPMIESF